MLGDCFPVLGVSLSKHDLVLLLIVYMTSSSPTWVSEAGIDTSGSR